MTRIYYTETDVITDHKIGKTRSTVKAYFAESDGFITHFCTEIEYLSYGAKVNAVKQAANEFAKTKVTFVGDILPSPF